MTGEQAEDFLAGMLASARDIAQRSGLPNVVKINTISVSLHYYPLSGTWNWFYRGRGVANKGDVRRWLEGKR